MTRSPMELFPVETSLIAEHDDLAQVFISALKRNGLTLNDGDVVVVASKVVGLVEGKVRRVSDVKVTKEATKLATKNKVTPALMQLILGESDSIVGGSPGFILAVRKGFPCVNACIDSANSPIDSFTLPPDDADESARLMRERIIDSTGKRVAVVVADSGLLPGRRGTIGVALGFAGLKPLKNYVGRKDLYGRSLRVTFQSVIDDIASAAKLLMGEADERVPFVLVRDAPVEYTEERIGIDSTILPFNICIFMNSIRSRRTTRSIRR
ncbi:MAG: coenzyme F420-0:L-glutamate ligase [Candidatus Atabeyarchaeum deiterrae]